MLETVVRLNDPQLVPPQVTVHTTMEMGGPLETDAVRNILVLTSMEAGTEPNKETEIGVSEITMVAETDFVESAIEVAVIVTVSPEEIVDGAV